MSVPLTSEIFFSAPSEPPKDIQENKNEKTLFSITINWEPIECIHQNGNVTRYIIRYWEKDSGIETKVDGNTTNLMFILIGLQPSTTYLIQVAGETRAGIGAFGNVTASTQQCELVIYATVNNYSHQNMFAYTLHTVEVMTSTTATNISLAWPRVNNSVTISWKMMASSQCVENGTDGESHSDESHSDEQSFMISDLKEFSEYNITVCINGSRICASKTVVTNQTGSYIIMYTCIFHVPFSAPTAAPTDVSVNGMSSTSITISWGPVPCVDRNGIVTKYVVKFRETTSEMFQNKSVTGNEEAMTITALKPLTMYEVKVAAFTVGTGPFSDSVHASTSG